ncbi:hypothetical protein BH11BAC3_BH11BAC3_02140 [soil metagenome]
MKRCLNFTLILIISIAANSLACGPYFPYGDDVRFCVFQPANFSFQKFSAFYYTAGLFNYDEKSDLLNGMDCHDENIILWRTRCNNLPLYKDIYDGIYRLNDLAPMVKENTFAKYLYQVKDFEAIDYLNFAKKCSPYNQVVGDPWERTSAARIPQRKQFMEQALQNIKLIKDEDIKLRYAFLAIRLAFYNEDQLMVKNIYEQYFSTRKKKNIIDYWSLYFATMIKQQTASSNYSASLVFSEAPDKRFMISFKYDKTIPLPQTLALAKTDKERAAIYLLDGIKTPARALGNIKSIYRLNPQNKGLAFLILREINKIEDWIFTPYYTNFPPSLIEGVGRNKMEKRIVKDKLYAKELLLFLQQITLSSTENPLVIKSSIAYLLYVTGDYSSALSSIAKLQKNYRLTAKIKGQLSIVYALCKTAQQPINSAVILDGIKTVIIKEFESRNYKFIFAIARELEFKNNTTDAAALLSKLNYEGEWSSNIFWKKRQMDADRYQDYYGNYFYYIDEEYKTGEIKDLLKAVEQYATADSFSKWKLQTLKIDLNRLYDLLGTKYIRLNKLDTALYWFQKLPESYWSNNDNYNYYLRANPFYTNFYNEHKTLAEDSAHFTKKTIVKQLLYYLRKAENVTNKNRDYYYFLSGNCYLNMTQYGNSWMMRRYYWTSAMQRTSMPDDIEYFTCGFAKQYYLKAKAVSTSKRFSALNLRMAARCEAYSLNFLYNDKKQNKYLTQIKQQYPMYYDDMVSNCESFGAYLKTRVKDL